MTATAGRGKDAAHPARARALATLRRTMANLAAWIGLLRRAPQGAGRRLDLLPGRRAFVAGSITAIVAVAAAMMLLDARAIEATRFLPLWVVAAFNEITDFGLSGWFLWPSGLLVIAIAALSSPALGRMTNLVLVTVVVRLQFVFLAVGIPGLIIAVGKRLIGRVRPSELGPFAYVPLSWRPDYASLPSGHATTAFSAAIAIGALFPRARPAMWIYAAIIAVSRVVISAHFPSDVIAGAVVGGFGALIVRNSFAARRLAFTVGLDGKIRPWPGPSLQRIKTVARRIVAH